MKNIRKIIAVFTALLMVATTSYAAGISFENVVANDVVSVDLVLDAVPADIEDISAITIRYEYDDSKLEYVTTASREFTNLVATPGNIIWYDPAYGTDSSKKITGKASG